MPLLGAVNDNVVLLQQDPQDSTDTAILVLLSFLVSLLFSFCCLLCLCLRLLILSTTPPAESPEHHINNALQIQQQRDTSAEMNAWTLRQRHNFDLATSFEQNFPAKEDLEFTLDQLRTIRERGVVAWKFVTDSPPPFSSPRNPEVLVQDQTELVFFGGHSAPYRDAAEENVACVQTNLPIPKVQDTYYFEVKLFEKAPATNVGIGLATKPYPSWRFPGRNKHSVGYHSLTGRKYYNDAFSGHAYGQPLLEGDVLGVAYRPRNGQVFFTRNGVKMDTAFVGFKNLAFFPTVAADGPCILEVNLGQAGFVLIEANVKKWGLAPVVEELRPPPAYGVDGGSVLLEIGAASGGSSSSSGAAMERGVERTASRFSPAASTSTTNSSRRGDGQLIRYKGKDGAPEVEVLLELTNRRNSPGPSNLPSRSPPGYDQALLDSWSACSGGQDAAAYEARLERCDENTPLLTTS